MPVVLRIALRNLLEHRSKSLIIGLLITLGVVIIIIGNSFLDASREGIRKAFIEKYTGDVFVSATKPDAKISLFGVQSMSSDRSLPALPFRDKVEAELAKLPGVKASAPVITGFGIFKHPTIVKQSMYGGFLFGIEPDSYRSVLDSLKVVDGEYLKPGEEGIMMTPYLRDEFQKVYGVPLEVGDIVQVNGGSMSSAASMGALRIREVPLRAVVEFKDRSAETDFFSFIDAQDLRAMVGLGVTDEGAVATAAQSKYLGASEDDMFAGDMFAADGASTAAPTQAPQSAAAPQEAASTAQAVADTGSVHFLIVRTKSDADAPAVVSALNAFFKEEGIEAEAGDWQKAAGPYVVTIDGIRQVFIIAIFIVAIVAIIIMMNTLVVSIIERTGEIGTMRALGGSRPFVWKLFFAETVTLTTVFGLVGLALSGGIIALLDALALPATNALTEVLFGGKVLSLALNPAAIPATFVMVALIGVLSHIYPVVVALKVPPLRAIQQE